jgi:hypothetical protein
VGFPLTNERARILSATNAVPLPAAQTGLWLPTADLGMLRRLRCAGGLACEEPASAPKPSAMDSDSRFVLERLMPS